ncbi:DUF4129 domain-containing protein [Streptomyces sp. NPDC001380]|uniref:DUF4129 domain-containing protein n=1 Tax=Streptomyces sp. NPDC001380 TaxID=3364566 RepID=UPI003678BD93
MGSWGEGLRAAVLADGGAPVTVGRDAAREAARRELSDPAYHRNDPGLAERLLSWVWRQLDRLLGLIGGTGTGGTAGLVLFGTVLLLAGAALWWRLGAPRRTARTAQGQFLGDRRRTAAEHRAAAERHAEAGRWSDALQERTRALVRSLEERALLDERPGRTADEAAAAAGQVLPEHAEALRRAARTFDGVVYGGRPAGPEAYREVARLDTALLRARPAHPVPAGTAAGSTAGGSTAGGSGGHV